MKTQHQNPEFGHTQGDIKKDLEKITLAFKGRGKGGNETQKTIHFVVN